MNKEIDQLTQTLKIAVTDWLAIKRPGSIEATKISIEQLIDYINSIINLDISVRTSGFKGVATPLLDPGDLGEGSFFWITAEPGEYVNFDNLTVNPSSIAVIGYSDGIFSISQTEIELTDYVKKDDVINDLVSENIYSPLSALQGKVLNENINLVSDVINGIYGDNRDFSTYDQYAMPDYMYASFVDRRQISYKSRISKLNVKAITNSNAVLFVAKKGSGNALKITYVLNIQLIAGNNEFDFLDKKYAPDLEKYDYVGIYAPGSNFNTALARDENSNPNRYRKGLNTVASGSEFDFLNTDVSLAFNYEVVKRKEDVVKLSSDFSLVSPLSKLIRNAKLINDFFPIQGGDKSVLIVPYTTSSYVWINGIDFNSGGVFKWALLKDNFEKVEQINVQNITSPYLVQTGGASAKFIAFELDLLTSDFNVFNQTSNSVLASYDLGKSKIKSLNYIQLSKSYNAINFPVKTIVGERNTRQDQPDILRMSNGDMICAYTNFYTNNIEDDAPSKVSYRTSADGGQTWGLEKDMPQAEFSNMIPIFHKKIDGTIIVLILANIEGADLENYIYKIKSTDGSVTWSAPEKVIEFPGEYIVTKPGTIIRDKDNSLLLPMSQYNKATGGYFGRIFRSEDDGETWEMLGLTIDNGRPSAIIVETDLFIRLDGKYAFSFRSGTGRLDAVISNDLSAMLPDLVKIVDAPESQSAIKYIENSAIYIACYNKFNGLITGATGARKDLSIAISRDGINFKEYPELLYKGDFGDEQVIEPTIYEDPSTNNVFILFSPTNYYPNNAVQYFNVASIILTPEVITRMSYELNI